MIKNLLDYNFPEDLKKMSEKDLELLSYSIRDFLLDNLAKTGGHLASNLGVVELSIALHSVFDSPKDKIIWDVGHQSYVHKILTGRGDKFGTLRQFKGLSGFPKAAESEHDIYDTGHSSTSISAAAGLAASRDLKGEDNEVIAVIGDGSLTGGMAFEALNNIGDMKTKVIVVVNDNGMSISRNIGGVSRHLDNLRTSGGYIKAKSIIKKGLRLLPNDGKSVEKALSNIKNNIKYSVMARGGILFEEFGFTYLGPVDGHNIADLTEAFNMSKALDEPVVVHVISKKGKGYVNAEKDPGKFHGIGAFNKETGCALAKSDKQSWSSAMGQKLVEIGREDQSIVAISAAMCDGTGLNYFADEFPERFYDVGIAEQHAVSFAAGLAKGGFKPCVAVYSTFLQRAYDQILEDVCLQKLPVTFAIDRAGVVGADGETHNGVFDIAYLSSMPNMTILSPSNADMLRKMMDYSFGLGLPCAIRYPRGNAPDGEALSEAESMSKSDGGERDVCAYFNRRYSTGEHVEIVATGKMMEYTEALAERLSERGIEAGIVEIGMIKPLNIDGLKIDTNKLIVTMEDHVLTGGFGRYLGSKLLEQNNGEALNILNIAWPDKFIEHGSFEQLADEYGLSTEAILERICERLGR